jgi:hypothetical protein
MMRRCGDGDFEVIWAIINDAAMAYKGIIPADRWTEPYMPREELSRQIDERVLFWGYEETGTLLAVMGIQQVQDVTLIRHAYVRTSSQKRGIGARVAVSLACADEHPGTDRNLGGCGVGDPVLRKTPLSISWAAGEGSAAQEILDYPRAPG